MVCGASQGIGLAAAQALAESGASVIALARSADRLREVTGKLPGPGSHSWLAADVGNHADLIAQAQAELNRRQAIHILVNNAGGPKSGPVTEAKSQEFLQGFQNHVLASSALTQLLLHGMRAATYGRVINIISTSVKMPIPNLGVSNTIRAAMANWAKTLAGEVAGYGITVNNVLPGYTDTPRLQELIHATAARLGKSPEQVRADWRASIPAGRLAEPREIANAVVFLASPAASYITGINLPVDGGRLGCL